MKTKEFDFKPYVLFSQDLCKYIYKLCLDLTKFIWTYELGKDMGIMRDQANFRWNKWYVVAFYVYRGAPVEALPQGLSQLCPYLSLNPKIVNKC